MAVTCYWQILISKLTKTSSWNCCLSGCLCVRLAILPWKELVDAIGMCVEQARDSSFHRKCDWRLQNSFIVFKWVLHNGPKPLKVAMSSLCSDTKLRPSKYGLLDVEDYWLDARVEVMRSFICLDLQMYFGGLVMYENGFSGSSTSQCISTQTQLPYTVFVEGGWFAGYIIKVGIFFWWGNNSQRIRVLQRQERTSVFRLWLLGPLGTWFTAVMWFMQTKMGHW